MNAKEFTEKVYGPYGDAWKVIKILAQAEGPATSEALSSYMDHVGEFKEKYEGNQFAALLYRMLLTADDAVMGMNK